ncbi:phenylalanine--tRNA ligase subunit beta [Pseudoflavonifractor sp. BIOML-A3]|nr:MULTISPECIES: phenylalanine--tRNA ligase subunit beta [unclassified Pseudoflavonifractor]MTQ97757.1 phenylalanine--tRNA ligase subunit beta [Pseudoflavonifractor sp. BIOML-A16]MTR06744.1 phenylalanine--tRNA ligase subunit beta [Pseudoflavonifractor sp. BIOML-A15]MTR73996.1 phenylalanine--tRNA ligase subunit beta [Pseudoflavonifractor sp. BIOML-A18]MTS64766.1 phenylalanine--tRNA ligase subunit beta [Pseudoflavonifractor sp. BIOML-A5]MTS72958.1 phenylalanine--tRNA ligase subunit beta [Pseudof
MNLSRKWLTEFVDIHVSDKEYCDAMTLSGSKVEGVSIPGGEIKNVVVGTVLSMERHPDSDHMFTCSIDAGTGAPIQIVTGAQNVEVGDCVPVAMDDSWLPGGVHITAGKLRGVESCGMLCSLKELGLTTHDYPYAIEDGIFILSDDPDLLRDGLAPGADVVPLLGLDDSVVEFEITPNRPDCLSVIGLARETAATFGAPLKLHTPKVRGTEGETVADILDVEIEDPDLCPRYTARMVRNVKIAPSPEWMRRRLRSSGVRPINNIVDITNYVMLEYGQPMHAFDFSCVEGGKIIVRTAREGEVIQTLDGADRSLTTNMLCICDEHRPVGVAGVMGGANSEIMGDTAMVVFESANFNGVSIRRTATALGMRTDASARYEKGLDPMNTYKGVQRACELVELLGCGEVVDGVIDVIAADQNPRTVKLEPAKINALLGTDISEHEMRAMLERLDFKLEGDTITVPSWRSDVEHYSDIAEEVARLHGYDKIPVTLMRGETTQGGFSDKQKSERQTGALLRGMGYSEIITYSFISPSYYDKIRLPADSALRRSVTILNPLGEDTSVMRTTALPSMLETLARNYSYRNKAARLYEIATVYHPVDGQDLAEERPMLSLGAYGGDADFFALKGVVEAVLAAMNVRNVRFESRSGIPAFHPGRCARVTAGGVELGVLGQLHPLTAQNYSMDCDVFAAQLDFLALLEQRAGEARYEPLPRFPSVTRDIAVVCGDDVTVAALVDCIGRGARGLLKEVELFDIYTGAPIPAGRKSVAFNLTLRAEDRSLTAAEADEDVKSVLALLESELGAVLR